MPSRPKKPPAAKMVPGGSYMATESARVVRKRLEASIEHRVTIPVTDDNDNIITLTVHVISVSRTTAACRFTDDRSLIVMLGGEKDEDKPPVILLDKLI